MEELSKLYLELANVVPADCVSSREIALKKQIDAYGVTLMIIAEGCADPQKIAAAVLNKFIATRRSR